MDYNTTRGKLAIKEYGRHVQEIIENCKSLPDREQRNRMAHEIIELMALLNPQIKNMEDYRHKLWDHLVILSGFDIDVDAPYPMITREEVYKKPNRLAYPKNTTRYKHYGRYVEKLVKKARETEDVEKRDEFAQCIGNYMKLVYQNWNQESVNDEVIKNDLRLLSQNELALPDDADLSSLSRSNRQLFSNNGKKKQNNKKKFYKKNFKKNK